MIFVIGGVTASGKSDLAFRLAKAINGIVINADAFAFYKELEIGTAKPSAEELNAVPTFLFNNISLDERFSIYNYQKEARAILTKYHAENIPIIFVGGSGLYLKAVLYNYNLQPEKELIIEDDPQYQ
ncbi:MAG: isopentenyl transferase family protein [Bacilli bacterium]